MAWVEMRSESASMPALEEFYRRTEARAGKLPNIARVQSLRPITALRGFDLYCQVMDDPTGLSRRDRVLIATVVSKVNGCLY
jgi:alkylhydroperoxidase family enzyme